MKIAFALFLMLILNFLVLAQTATKKDGPPDLEVLTISWRYVPPPKNNIDMREYRNNGGPLQNPDRGRNDVANIEVKPLYRSDQIKPVWGLFVDFTVRNSGSRTIRKIVWDYFVVDPANGKRVGFRQYKANVKIHPGATAKLIAKATGRPIGFVDANQPDDANDANQAPTNRQKQPTMSNQSNEEVNIQRVEYSDGTVWKHQ